jgi:hypothetical protein
MLIGSEKPRWGEFNKLLYRMGWGGGGGGGAVLYAEL